MCACKLSHALLTLLAVAGCTLKQEMEIFSMTPAKLAVNFLLCVFSIGFVAGAEQTVADVSAHADKDAAKMVRKTWPEGKSFDLKRMKVTLSAPVLVKRDREPYYFPKIARLPNGEIILHSAIDCPLNLSITDESFKPERAEVLWSSDGGLTWKDPQIIPDGSSLHVLLPNGDMMFAPYRLFELPK